MDMNLLFASAPVDILTAKAAPAMPDAAAKATTASAAPVAIPFNQALQTAAKTAMHKAMPISENISDEITEETLNFAAIQCTAVVLQMQQQLSDSKEAVLTKLAEPAQPQNAQMPNLIQSLAEKADKIQLAVNNAKELQALPAENAPVLPVAKAPEAASQGKVSVADFKELFGSKLETAQPVAQFSPGISPENTNADTRISIRKLQQNLVQSPEGVVANEETLAIPVAETLKNAKVQDGGPKDVVKEGKTPVQVQAQELGIEPEQVVAKPAQTAVDQANIKPQPQSLAETYADTAKTVKAKPEMSMEVPRDNTSTATSGLAAASTPKDMTPIPQRLDFSDKLVDPKNVQDIVDNLVEQAKLTQKPGISEMIIRLKPENLGEMTVRITAETNGIVTASFHSNNPEVRQMIQEALPALRQELSNSGLKVNDVGVYAGLGDFQSFAQQHQEAGQFARQTGQSRNRLSADDVKLLDELQTIGSNQSDEGGVDYRI